MAMCLPYIIKYIEACKAIERNNPDPKKTYVLRTSTMKNFIVDLQHPRIRKMSRKSSGKKYKTTAQHKVTQPCMIPLSVIYSRIRQRQVQYVLDAKAISLQPSTAKRLRKKVNLLA
jgi:hypothetical protein